MADMPSMDVESNPPVPTVTTRFHRGVAHGKGGVFLFVPQAGLGKEARAFRPLQNQALRPGGPGVKASLQFSFTLVRSRSHK